jgi:hypothetical protein
MSLLILYNSSEQKNTSSLDAVKQFKRSLEPVFSIFQIEDLKTTDFEALNRDPGTKGGVLFLHPGIATVKKDEQLSKGAERWYEKIKGFDLWFEGSNTSVSELINLFVYKKPKGKSLYGTKYSPANPPVVIPLFVDKITPRISSIINGALGIDEFGRTLRKVYVVAIPLGPLTTKQQTNKKIEKALQQLADILERGFVLSDIVTQFPGAKHYVQHEQFDSDDDEETEIRHSLDNALSINIGRATSKAKPPPAPPPAQGNGAALPTPSPEVIQTDDEVNCTVYAPNDVAAGAQFLVQVFAHTAEQQSLLDDLAKLADDSGSRRGSVSLEEKVARETRIDFNLMMPGLEIDEPNLSIKWQGKIASVQFGVQVPSDFVKPGIIGKVTVVNNSVPIGQLKFKINVVASATPGDGSLKNNGTMERFKLAFISYSSQDRPEVLKRVQMLNLVKLKFFQDLLTLEPGDEWEKLIPQYISTCDVFFLFWSKAASESTWVKKEILLALGRKGDNDDLPPEIIPVIIEGPPPAKPPDELNFLHFNDKFMYFINAQR